MTGAPHPFKLVIWDDAHVDVDEFAAKDWEKHRPDPIFTAGYVIKDDEAGMSIAWEWLGEDNYRTITFIPRGMVREVRPVSLAIPRKRKPREVVPGVPPAV